MKQIFLAVITMSALLAGCLSDSKKIETPQPLQAAPAQLPTTTADPSAATVPPAQNVPPAQGAVPSPVVNTSSSVKLNPAHGMPGHRCDISVGAPLDSKPSQPATSTTTVQATPTQAAPPVVLPQATGKGLNPAHGQPGHRCDIAVGAPLDSKPAQ